MWETCSSKYVCLVWFDLRKVGWFHFYNFRIKVDWKCLLDARLDIAVVFIIGGEYWWNFRQAKTKAMLCIVKFC